MNDYSFSQRQIAPLAKASRSYHNRGVSVSVGMSVNAILNNIIIRDLGLLSYERAWEMMREFTDARTENTPDEIWLLEHPPVFTQGLAGKPEHVLNPHHIPIIQTDRGGQVTYHGPGQLVMYVLIDLKRKELHARDLVRKLEQSVIDLLATHNISALSRCDAPGVYVNDAKICSIGLRVRRNCSYHGIALNIAMDLTPFSYINPCGYSGMAMTQITTFDSSATVALVKKAIIPPFLKNFGYTAPTFATGASTDVTK